jgi:hypothetical protein
VRPALPRSFSAPVFDITILTRIISQAGKFPDGAFETAFERWLAGGRGSTFHADLDADTATPRTALQSL